jgi:hypothetical protein
VARRIGRLRKRRVPQIGLVRTRKKPRKRPEKVMRPYRE